MQTLASLPRTWRITVSRDGVAEAFTVTEAATAQATARPRDCWRAVQRQLRFPCYDDGTPCWRIGASCRWYGKNVRLECVELVELVD